jgi:hypothetical protein
MRFRGTLELNGRTATGIEVPAEVMAGLPGKRPAVAVTINGHTFRTSVGSVSGRSMLPVSAEIRKAAELRAGDEVDVALEVDEAPREVVVPDDLAAALADEPTARTAFGKLSYSLQRRYVLGIEDAKTPQTRQRRIAKAVAELSG